MTRGDHKTNGQQIGVIQRWSNRYYTGGRGGGGGVVKVIRSHEEAKENIMAWQGCFVVVGAPRKKKTVDCQNELAG